jgi:PAS domain S-box-containing protein
MINLQILKTAFMNSRESITIADLSLPDIPLIFVNPAFEEMTGYFLDEIVGQNCRHLQLTDVGQKDELNTIREAIKNNKSCLVTLRNYRKDDSMFWNELSLSPIFNDAGEPSYYLGIHNDVSEKVLIQKAIINKKDGWLFKNLRWTSIPLSISLIWMKLSPTPAISSVPSAVMPVKNYSV